MPTTQTLFRRLCPTGEKRRWSSLVVTLVWGATFIWMKQALNAFEVEIETFGTFSVVAFLVALRFSIAMALVAVVFPKTVAGLTSAPSWKGGGILGGLMLIGFCQPDGGAQRHQPVHVGLSHIAVRGDDRRADRCG